MRALSVLALALAGCAPVVTLPEGTFVCEAPSDCPESWSCRADRRCWRTAGQDVDGGVDSGADHDAGADRDAGLDGGADAGRADAGDGGLERDGGPHDGGDVRCGDGMLGGDEGCDDGARVGGDGCDAECQVEVGYRCSGEPSTCVDVDECAEGTASCPPSSSCRNRVGGYDCPCDCGFVDEASMCSASRVIWPASHRTTTFDMTMSYSGNTMRATRVRIDAATRLVRFEATTNNFGVNLQAALYRDDAGVPGDLVTDGGVSARSPATPSIIGTTNLLLSGCVRLDAGDYWIVWNQAANLSYRSAATSVQVRAQSATFSAGLPDRLGTTVVWSTDFFDAVRIDVITE